MSGGTSRELPPPLVISSPAVAANAEGDEIEVLESTDVLPVAPEDVSLPSTAFCDIVDVHCSITTTTCSCTP